MDVSIEERWQGLVDRLVSEGRNGSPDDVAREGLRFVQDNEAQLVALAATLDKSVAQGGEMTDEALDAANAERGAELKARGIGE